MKRKTPPENPAEQKNPKFKKVATTELVTQNPEKKTIFQLLK